MNTTSPTRARAAWRTSDGAVTRALYDDLARLGAPGYIALNLFRACKCSARAKKYRGGVTGQGSYSRMAYDRKQWSLDNLCKALAEHAHGLAMKWGWKCDPNTPGYPWVLYVDLPQGQVSFHAPWRGKGPEYPGEWDRERVSHERIIDYCDALLAGGAE